MKRLTYLVAVLLLASFNLQAQWGPILSASVVSSGGGCSPSQGNILADEGFEVPTTGYETSGWNVATGSPNPAYSITGLTTAKPNGSCTQGFESNYSTGGTYPCNSWDSGSNHAAIVYVRFYLYVASHSLADGFSAYVAGTFQNAAGNSDGNRCCVVAIKNTGGQLQIYGRGGNTSSAVNISTGTWILVELKSNINATAGGSAIKINGGTAQTFTDAGYDHWRSIGIGTYGTDNTNFTLNDCVFDLLAADSSAYIGPTP